MKRDYTPGLGWTYKGPCVWDHVSGLRIHVYGLCVVASGYKINGRRWPESQELDRCIRIAGGNRRRGTMIWAMKLNSERSER